MRRAMLPPPRHPAHANADPTESRPYPMFQISHAPATGEGGKPAAGCCPPLPARPLAGRPWLSILIPVYNVAGYLHDCLQSMLVQLQPGIEIVVLDDASTDASAAIIADMRPRFGAALCLIRHPHNRGLAAARNTLLQNATGDYLWFVDADDLLAAGAIASLRRVLDSVSPDLLTCDFRMHRQDFGLKHRLRGEAHRHTFGGPNQQLTSDRSTLVHGILILGQLHAWSKIARREVWSQVRFPEGRYFEDIAALPMLVDATRSHFHVDEPWVVYRQRSGSILASMGADKIRHQLQALDALNAALGPSRTELDREAAFAVQHFMLKSLASLARRLARDRCAESAELMVLLRESLRQAFPNGSRPTLLAYCRRGWLLRARRAHASLRRVGLPSLWSP